MVDNWISTPNGQSSLTVASTGGGYSSIQFFESSSPSADTVVGGGVGIASRNATYSSELLVAGVHPDSCNDRIASETRDGRTVDRRQHALSAQYC
jgi:hypothetical protein